MERIISTILIIVGLINIFPAIGVISAATLSNLYGIAVLDGDLLLLMRHRAVLFGVLGGLLIIAAFRPRLQIAAATMALISMVAFVALAISAGAIADDIKKIMYLDVGASLATVYVLLVRLRALRQ